MMFYSTIVDEFIFHKKYNLKQSGDNFLCFMLVVLKEGTFYIFLAQSHLLKGFINNPIRTIHCSQLNEHYHQ